jgi:hypothetical protein
MRRKTWDAGNLFAIQLADGSYVLGQVVSVEPQLLDAVTCAFFRTRVDGPGLGSVTGPPDFEQAVAVQFVTKDLLASRVWKVLGNYPVTVPSRALPHEDKRASGWVGARIIGSGIITHFLNALFGLESWTQMKDPAYFDGLLLRPELRRAGSGQE